MYSIIKIKDKWYHFNDSNVIEIHINDIKIKGKAFNFKKFNVYNPFKETLKEKYFNKNEKLVFNLFYEKYIE